MDTVESDGIQTIIQIIFLVADARERRLRSTASRTCVVSRDADIYSTFGDRAFSAAGPGL